MNPRRNVPITESRRPTAADVAERAGVSKTAVSFAFNRPTRISEQTQLRILEAAKELGYKPSTLGRMLSSGSTNALGLLLPQAIPEVMQNPYYAQFMVGVGHVCRDRDYSMLLVPPTRDSMLRSIPTAAVDGFIVSGLEVDRGEVDELRSRRIPFVLVDSEASADVPSVEVDDAAGSAAMIHHLMGLGHERIAIIAFDSGPHLEPDEYRGPLARRMLGIASALAEYHLSLHDDVPVVETPATRLGGQQAARQLMGSNQPPTAIFALSDILAVGAIDAAREMGLRVPVDVSIAGFDDLPEASWLSPRLTTVRQPIVAKGRLAADFLVAALHGEPSHPREVLQTMLVARESTATPPLVAPPMSP